MGAGGHQKRAAFAKRAFVALQSGLDQGAKLRNTLRLQRLSWVNTSMGHLISPEIEGSTPRKLTILTVANNNYVTPQCGTNEV